MRAVVNFLVGLCLFVLPSFVRSRLAYKFYCGCPALVVVASALAVTALLLLLLLPALLLLLVLLLLLWLSCCYCSHAVAVMLGSGSDSDVVRKHGDGVVPPLRCCVCICLFAFTKLSVCIYVRVFDSLSVRACVFTFKLQAFEPGKQ